MKSKNQVGDEVMEGVLIPVRWDPAGAVSQVSLMTFDEAEYRVDLEAAEAHNLREHLRKHVRIRGRIRGNRVVGLTSVEILETLAAPDMPRQQGKEKMTLDWTRAAGDDPAKPG